jgi:hypothetical protein
MDGPNGGVNCSLVLDPFSPICGMCKSRSVCSLLALVCVVDTALCYD